MEQFFSDEDLMDLLEQLDEVEMTALPEEPVRKGSFQSTLYGDH